MKGSAMKPTQGNEQGFFVKEEQGFYHREGDLADKPKQHIFCLL